MKTQILTKVASYTLAGVLMVTPLVGFAKSDASVRAHAQATVQTSSTTDPGQNGCRAFGHFIAPGWLKHHVAPLIPEGCVLPFGIGKILRGDRGHSTSTPTDTTAPTIRFVRTKVTDSTATISWFTNERSTSQVVYGTSTSYGAQSAPESARVFFHSVTLTGLTASTTYHFAVKSTDAAGNTATSADATFTTTNVADTSSPTISAFLLSAIGSTTATVSWHTDEPATSKVYYSTSSPVDLLSASFVSSGALVANHSVNLTGLSASTTYHVVVQSSDSSGNTATTSGTSFITLP